MLIKRVACRITSRQQGAGGRERAWRSSPRPPACGSRVLRCGPLPQRAHERAVIAARHGLDAASIAARDKSAHTPPTRLDHLQLASAGEQRVAQESLSSAPWPPPRRRSARGAQQPAPSPTGRPGGRLKPCRRMDSPMRLCCCALPAPASSRDPPARRNEATMRHSARFLGGQGATAPRRRRTCP
jgi:hypothetical protein